MDSKKLRNYLMGAVLGLSLTSGASTAYAQTQNRIKVDEDCSEKSELYFRDGLSAAGDGTNLRSSIANIHLNPDSRITLDDFFCFNANEGEVSYDVINAVSGIENKISYEKANLDSRDPQSKRERLALIDHYEQLLENIEDSDDFSLSLLKNAVSDGVLDVKGDFLFENETWKILPGTYTLVGRSEGSVNGEYVANSLPVPSNVILEKYTSAQKSVSNSDNEKSSSKSQLKNKPSKFSEFFGPERSFGLEAVIGGNGSSGVGAFGNVQLANSSISLGIFGRHYIKGELFENSETEIMEIERKLIGPGTYLNRKDIIETTSSEEVVGEIGLRPSLNIGKSSIFGELGVAWLKGDEVSEGTGVISYERNGVPFGESSTITNEIGEKTSRKVNTFALGFDYNVNDDWSVGISGKNIDGKGSVELNLKYVF
ncbi:MAG: hypothetical protein WDZ77_03375 [Candidatus Pacearchaeota archaeon]